jgi:redox-sensing transcriptional repressor
MNNAQGISDLVINRLPRYHRFLGELMQEGVERISSRELSERMGLTASQIRQDLNCFGGFGQQGYGYHIDQLYAEIGKILGLDKPNKAILIGAGNLGRAIASHMAFETKGFKLIGMFDKKEALKGQIIKGLPVRHIDDLDDFCRENLPKCAILCIPETEAEELCDMLIGLGIKGFWNFSHCDLTIKHPDIIVENVHLGDSLMKLSYGIKNQ